MNNYLSEYLPVTVVAAISLFLIKEIVEFFKRKGEKKRKLDALKSLMSEELLVNAAALKFLRRLCSAINVEDIRGVEYKKTSSGTERVIVLTSEKTSVNYFWKLRTAVFEKVMTELAALDGALFPVVAEAYAKINEVKHVRESIIDFSELEMPKHLIRGLGDYGKNQIDDAVLLTEQAYKKLTGNELTQTKIRSFV